MSTDIPTNVVPNNDVVFGDRTKNSFGQQRHLSTNFQNSPIMKVTVKSRIKEIETRNFNNLYKGTPKKVKRSTVKLKSPIIRCKQPTNHRRLSSSSSTIKLSSSKSDKKKEKGVMNIGKVRGIVDNFDSNLISKTPKKGLNFNDDGGILDHSRRKDIQIDAFEFLMGTKGDTRTKTPVKKRVKRLENGDFTKSGEKFLDMKNWASKCHKKCFLKFYNGKVYFLKSSTAKCRNF